MKIQSKESNDERQLENHIYANLKALGVDVDKVRNCSPTLSQLKEFHEGIMSILKRQQGNIHTVIS